MILDMVVIALVWGLLVATEKEDPEMEVVMWVTAPVVTVLVIIGWIDW
jgi:hypothetical protein|tara:strand:- start:1197 stop:1340 length:144 start_codon:yes stop_codon:yes gene_type:complete